MTRILQWPLLHQIQIDSLIPRSNLIIQMTAALLVTCFVQGVPCCAVLPWPGLTGIWGEHASRGQGPPASLVLRSLESHNASSSPPDAKETGM